jgi:hypothetical protein
MLEQTQPQPPPPFEIVKNARRRRTWIAYWMLMRPTTPKASATSLVHSRMTAKVSSGMDCVGIEHAESPEWMPACSMCSMMPQMTTLPWESRSASTSSSTARSRYLSTSTGRSGSTSTAVVT